MILNMTLQPTKSVWSPPGMASLETSEQASGCLPARLHRLLLYSSSAENTRLHPYLLNVTHKMRLVPATSPRLWATGKFRTKEGKGNGEPMKQALDDPNGKPGRSTLKNK